MAETIETQEVDFLTTPIPKENIPDSLKPYAGKTFGDVVNARDEAQRTMKKTQSELDRVIKEREAEQAELEELRAGMARKRTKKKEPPAAEPTGEQNDVQVPKGYVKADDFQKALAAGQIEYMRNGGKLTQDTLNKLSGFGVMGKDMILDQFELAKHKRSDIVAQYAETLPEFSLEEMATMETYLLSGESGYSKQASMGLFELMQNGDTSWVPGVVKKMRDFIASGGQFTDPGTGQRFGNVQQVIRGNPAGPHAHAGYATKDEYRAELKKASDANDSKALNRVEQKLASTPASVRNQW